MSGVDEDSRRRETSDEKEDTEQRSPVPFLSRRSTMKRVAAIGGLAGLGLLGYLRFATQPALAMSGHDSWVAEGASITSQDGSVDALTFGETGEDDDLHLSWSGLNADDSTVNFRILLSGDDDGDADGWNDGAAGPETDYEELAIAEPGITLESTNGTDDYTWEDVFGVGQPVDVDEHSQIDVAADFSAEEDGEERVRSLTVDVEVWITEEDGANGPDENALGDRKEATATITVTNQEATIEIGGQGTFELTSNEEIEED